MKFVITLEQQVKISRTWTTNDSREYMVKVPNHQSPDFNEMYQTVKGRLEKEDGKVRFVAAGYHVYADDAPTVSERLQADLNGAIMHSPIEIDLDPDL